MVIKILIGIIVIVAATITYGSKKIVRKFFVTQDDEEFAKKELLFKGTGLALLLIAAVLAFTN
ncbi:MAG: hypothetical protein H7Y41_06990 [Hyphomonadaceae bacterium]|nr:hypothetical protein [Clostridia bacterium]